MERLELKEVKANNNPEEGNYQPPKVFKPLN